jgi:hypothetical protein
MLPVEFQSYDWASIRGLINFWPEALPDLSPGQVFVFPLRRGAKAARGAAQANAQGAALAQGEGVPGQGWRLLEEPGINLLTPALPGEPPPVAPRDASASTTSVPTGFDFLCRELANVLAQGDEAQIRDVMGRYYLNYWGSISPLHNTFGLIEQSVRDEERWLSIATTGLILSSRTTPRVPLRELLEKQDQPEKPKQWSKPELLLSRALGHLPRQGIERRLLRAVLRQSQTPNSGAPTLLLTDFASQPEVRTAFEAGLARDERQWTYAANWMTSDWMTGDEHPLADVALAWAKKHLNSPEGQKRPWEFCPVVRRWGSATDRDALAERIERARRSKDPSYKVWLKACASQGWTGQGLSLPSLPPRVWSPLLKDSTPYQDGFPNWRWCDQSALEINRAANLGLSIQRTSPLKARDQAVAAALIWWQRHIIKDFSEDTASM